MSAAAAIVAGLTSVAAAATAGAAVVVVGTGTLRAGGAAITFPVEVTCGPFDEKGYQWIRVQVSQAVGGSTAGGVGGTDAFVCDGTPQSLAVTVMADALGGRHFEQGVAVASVTHYACGYVGGIETCDGTDEHVDVALVGPDPGS